MFCGGNLENYFNKWIKGLNRLLDKIRLSFKPKFISPQFHQCIFR